MGIKCSKLLQRTQTTCAAEQIARCTPTDSNHSTAVDCMAPPPSLSGCTNSSNGSVIYNERAELRELKQQLYATWIPLLLSLCAAAVAANLLILLLSNWIRSKKTLTVVLTFGLAAADCWTSVVIGAGFMVNSYMPYVQGICFYQHFCIAYSLEALRLGAIMTSVLHLLVLSINHCLAIVCPILHRKWLKFHSILSMLAFSIWIFPSLGFMITFASFPDFGFQAENCVSADSIVLNWLSFRLTVFFLFLLPLLAMAFIYRKMCVVLYKMDKQLRQGRASAAETVDNAASQMLNNSASVCSASVTDDTYSTRSNTTHLSRQSTLRSTLRKSNFLKRKRKMLVTAGLILGSFLLGWLPSSALYLLTCDQCVFKYQKSDPIVLFAISLLTSALMIVKGLINPVIYSRRVPEFRHAMRQFCQSLCHSNMCRLCSKQKHIEHHKTSLASDRSEGDNTLLSTQSARILASFHSFLYRFKKSTADTQPSSRSHESIAGQPFQGKKSNGKNKNSEIFL